MKNLKKSNSRQTPLKANGYSSSIMSNILKKHPTETIPTPKELVGMFLRGSIHQTHVLISFVSLTSVASQNHSQDYFVTTELESSLNLTEPYNKNFLHQNSGPPLIFKPMIVCGIASVKPEDVFKLGKYNTSQTTLGRTT